MGNNEIILPPLPIDRLISQLCLSDRKKFYSNLEINLNYETWCEMNGINRLHPDMNEAKTITSYETFENENAFDKIPISLFYTFP